MLRIALVLLVAHASPSVTAQVPPKPNIVFILMDSLGISIHDISLRLLPESEEAVNGI